jgi:hypothetical protein
MLRGEKPLDAIVINKLQGNAQAEDQKEVCDPPGV